MKKFTYQKSLEYMYGQPAFFEGIRLNYGSYNKAGKALGVRGKLLEKYGTNVRGREIPNSEIKSIERALNKLPKSKRMMSENYIYSRGMLTGAQYKFTLQYATKGEKQRRWIRKQINEAAIGQKRVLMPALSATGKITNSPSVKTVKKTRSKRASLRRSRRGSNRR